MTPDITSLSANTSTYSHRYRKVQNPVYSPIVKPIIVGLIIEAQCTRFSAPPERVQLHVE